MKIYQIKIFGLALCYSLFSLALNAQHTEGEHTDHNNKHGEESSHDNHDASHDEHGTHEAHKNHIALFNGATTNFDHESTSYTLGLDYEYRIGKLLGLGIAAEIITTEDVELVFGIPVFFHPVEGLKFVAAPLMISLVEHAEHQEEDDHTDEGGHKAGSEPLEVERSMKFGFRVGVGYDFHLGKLSVGPSLNLDVANTTALVYGISIGMGF